MYMSKLYAPTLKEDPADAELASHRLLLRAGMIRKEAAGLYSYLPLAWRSIRKIENIVRDEMDAAGAQELMMPIMVDAELWRESGRIDAYGKELVRFDDRHGREFVLGPTHEETVTALVRNELRSYKQLPVNLYHIQDKFRDEFRPRFGLMRGREFIMKDAYSFSATQESLQEEYDKMKQAYANICERCYIKALPVVADSGEIGGDTSVEYMALAEAGEASLVYCDDCGFAADDEAASTKVVVTEGPGDGTLTKVETPGMGTIEAVAKFFGFPENGTRKSLALIDAEGKPVVAIVPGDHELNDCKAEHVFGKGYRMMTDEELQTYGLHKGFIGPVNLPEGIRLVCDESLRQSKQWACGANEVDYHFTGACPERDFTVDEWADLVTVVAGDPCPHCGKRMLSVKGKNSRMLVCQDRECGYRETIARTSNARCPNCHKKMELIKKGDSETFVCSCGYKEKLEAFKNRRAKEGAGVSKRDVQKYLKKQQQQNDEPVNNAFAQALAGLKLDK